MAPFMIPGETPPCSLVRASKKTRQEKTRCSLSRRYLSGADVLFAVVGTENKGPACPVCRWTAQGLCGPLRELMSNESDFKEVA